MLQKSIALNSIMYILLRYASVGDEDATSNIQAHPVMDQLKKFNSLLEKLEENVHSKTKDIDLQLDNLVKAAALMTNNNTNSSEDDDDDDLEEEEENAMEVANIEQQQGDKEKDDDNDEVVSKTSNDGTDKIRRIQKDYERSLNEARFGLRPEEAKKSPNVVSRKRRTDHTDDFGDLEVDAESKATSGGNNNNRLATTINTIEQRSQTASRKRRPAPVPEQLDDVNEFDHELAQGIKMMEEELGKIDDDDDDIDSGKGKGGDKDMTDPDADDDDQILGFYNKIAAKSKEKKSSKKSLYKVAPKYPRVDGEVAGERAISRVILKNRGLVAHKAKINRNPRVKKREQYRKALIRRKGAVREVRDEEGHKYGGEETGIKSGISRSRKL
jgi:U3 small nucleolar RNA-associated protein 3